VLHAGLVAPVLQSLVPRPVACLRLRYLRQREASPLAAGRQARAAAATDLIGEHFLDAVRVADDDRTQLAPVALVDAHDLLLVADRVAEDLVGRAHIVRICHVICAGISSIAVNMWSGFCARNVAASA